MLKYFSKSLKYKHLVFPKKKFMPSSFYFARKTMPGREKDFPNAQLEDYVHQGNKVEHVKVFTGEYSYLPLDDHPLIPGYSRAIGISKDILDKLKELNVEQNKLVISVLKNPEAIEGVQAAK